MDTPEWFKATELNRSVASFDAFPKTLPTYKSKSSRGGLFTVLLSLIIAGLVWYELKEYLYGEPTYAFAVDKGIHNDLQINVDMTVAMPCHFLSVDVRDAVGDRLHISEEIKKDGTTFEVGRAHTLANLADLKRKGASQMVRSARKSRQFKRTTHPMEDGPACRIYGSMHTKRVTGNLHVTTLGHGYMSWEHTDHSIMNLSHVIHELSFGPFFPGIAQPLDDSFEIASNPFYVFQFFVSIVSSMYVDAGGRALHTSQYSVSDMGKQTEHGKGVPGIFIKYDVEPIALTIRERTVLLHDFLIRLAGIVGGILVCSGYAWRISHWLFRGTKRQLTGAPKSGVSRGEKTGLMPMQSPQQQQLNGNRKSYL